MAECFFHMGRPAVTRCKQCGKPLCSDCRLVTENGLFCSDKCAQTGFSGRRGIYELLLMDDAVGPLVLRNADAQAIKRTAIDFGMDSLRDDGARKVISGLTSVEEVIAATQEDQGGVEIERPASMRNVRV